jgi:hypothetical protein
MIGDDTARRAKPPVRSCIAGLALLALAACAQSNSSAELSPQPPPPPQQATPSAAPPPPAPPPTRQAALTPEEVKAQCWMKHENDRRVKNIDQRLQLVEKCVDDTLRNQPRPLPAR